MNTYNSDVRTHSHHHLELKTEYPLFPQLEEKKAVYRQDLYFFFPAQLNVTGSRIGVPGALKNLKVYYRFSTPSLTLEKLMDETCTLSPLFRIRNILSLSELEDPDMLQSLVYELQMLVNMYRAEVKGVSLLIREEWQTRKREGAVSGRTVQFLNEIRRFLALFRELYSLFLNPHITDVQRKAYFWADESLSIITEQGMIDLFSFLRSSDWDESIRQMAEDLICQETGYREKSHYSYMYHQDDRHSGEKMAYRDSMLKKWSQSALYLNYEDSRTPRRIGHMLAGAAAGVAMLFAVMVTIFADRIFLRNSLAWALLIVISYIFKDRIKEILRDVFGRFLPRISADRQTRLKDPASGKKIGMTNSVIRFGGAGRIVPERILKERYRRPNPFRDILPEQDVMVISRKIRIKTKKLKSNHSRLKGITEILRFHVEDWLREMDDPKDILFRVDNGKKVKIKGNRVYHIHLIISMTDVRGGGSESLYHYRIVLNKSGIQRIEILDQDV